MYDNPLPNENELEVSLFGPGYGESVVVHIGNGRWVVIDSCVTKDEQPSPLKYLQRIGCNPTNDVVLVVATHWHDDHIRGLSKVFESCTSAKFACPSTLLIKEFVMLQEIYKGKLHANSSGVTEFSKIFDNAKNNGRKPVRMSANRVLFEHTTSKPPFLNVEVRSLSPTDDLAEAWVKQLTNIVTDRRVQPRMPDLETNQTSGVLLVKAGSDSILLGSDLTCGWLCIVRDDSRIATKSCVFKVPHHGSESGHNDEVWSEMLEERPFALITPFVRGNKNIPTTKDIERINSLTNKAYITRSPKAKKPSIIRDKRVERALYDANIKLNVVDICEGHIRFRMTPGQPKTRRVDVFNEATALSKCC